MTTLQSSLIESSLIEERIIDSYIQEYGKLGIIESIEQEKAKI